MYSLMFNVVMCSQDSQVQYITQVLKNHPNHANHKPIVKAEMRFKCTPRPRKINLQLVIRKYPTYLTYGEYLAHTQLGRYIMYIEVQKSRCLDSSGTSTGLVTPLVHPVYANEWTGKRRYECQV